MRLSKTRYYRAGAAAAAATAAVIGLFACNEVLGVGELELGECHPTYLQCKDSSQPQQCGEDRQWQDVAACVNQTCVKGECHGQCLAAARRCMGNAPQQCQEDGEAWKDEATCPFVCLGGQCAGVCVPKAVGCMNNTPRVCDDMGQWKDDPVECLNKTCMDGACIGECKAGTKRCGGTTPELCTADGKWKQQDPCPAGKACSGGDCKVVCTPGDLQCDGNTPQLCNDGGTWENSAPACDPCVGCDPANAKCFTTKKKEGDPCLTDDKCTLEATCQSGTCKATIEVQCAAGNQCSPGTCNAATGNCAVADGMACNDGDACTMTSTCKAGACEPAGDHSFAHWDVKAGPPDPRYTSIAYGDDKGPHVEDEVVFDNWTGLLWQRTMHPTMYVNWEEATAYCGALQIHGYPEKSWRLPTRVELASIVDYTKEFPAFDQMYFPWPMDSENVDFWTSSTPGGDPTLAWVVSFLQGYTYTAPKVSGNYYRNVRCVH